MNGIESPTTASDELYVELPPALEPTDLSFNISGGDFILSWYPPLGCLAPMSYSIYENGNFLVSTSETSFTTNAIGQEYFITAVYYFGESGPSNSILITNLFEVDDNSISVYPNPAEEKLYISSRFKINTIHLFDAFGRQVVILNQPETVSLLDISQLEAGIYFVIIESGNNTIERKIIVK